MNITLEKWNEAAATRDTSVMKEFLKAVCFQDLVDLLMVYENEFKKSVDDLNAARQAFINDCKQKDQAIDQERENLQREAKDQEAKIRSLSAQYQKALGAGNVKVIPDLKKQIATATAARDEAQSTLQALEGVKVEYDRRLYDIAEKAQEPAREAKVKLREVQKQIHDMRDYLEALFQWDSNEYRVFRNAGDSFDVARYDPLHWSNWSGKIPGNSQQDGTAGETTVSATYGMRAI